MTKWISVKERLPSENDKHPIKLLLSKKGHYGFGAFNSCGNREWFIHYGENPYIVEYWAELPNPPEGE